MKTPIEYSRDFNVRNFEKRVLLDSLKELHENGEHDEYNEPNCPLCENS